MYKLKHNVILVVIACLVVAVSCKDLDELNINPNGVDPANADLNLLLPTIETALATKVVELGFGDIGGVMQHTQKDGWSASHNDYNWDVNSNSWKSYYDILRNNNEYYKKAVENNLEFHQGVGLVLKSYTFGLITDLWGDAPYSEALKGDEGVENFKPAFDDQKDIYLGILADLETANTLLSGSDYSGVQPSQDVIFSGNASMWRKFANSLALRYYMRLSAKEPSIAQDGISRITSNPATYPLILSSDEDVTLDYVGSAPSDSWPTNTVFDESVNGSYFRVKMCATLVEALQSFNDPRLGVWANKIQTPLVLEPNAPDDTDVIIDGKRHISQNIVDDYETSWGTSVNYDENYVGIPPSIFAAPQYNLNPYLEQGVFNPHASQLNDIYKETNGPLLKSRLLSAAEVHFVLAEAAMLGWYAGDAETHYNMGVQSSLETWGVDGAYSTYIQGAPYTGHESIMTQKWIASWSSATEAWFDYRRTGLPMFQTGESAKRQALPIRFYYHFVDEVNLNTENAEAAISKLEPTQFKGSDNSNNSAWSKMWLLQGTGKPY